jgi:putative SOS response-associated peptidase YedK
MNKSGTVPNFIRFKDNKPIFVAGIYFVEESYSEEEPEAHKLVLMTQPSDKVK